MIGLTALLLAPLVRGGDPVPDIDVTIEQIPGDDAVVYVGDDRVEGSARFDEIVFDLPRKARELTPLDLPAGWVTERRRGELVVSGPEVPTPVRLRFVVGDERPGEVGVTVKQGGRVIAERRGLVPREVPVRRVRGTLSGIVQAPDQIAAGDTLAFRTLDEELPEDGQWTVSGVVAEPWSESLLSFARTKLNTTRSNIKLIDAGLPDEGIVIEGTGGCDVLLPIGVVLLSEGPLAAGSWTVEDADAELTGESPSHLTRLSLSPGRRGLRAMIAIKEKGVQIADSPGGDGVAVKEEGVNIADLDPPPDGVAVKEEGVNVAQPGGVHWRRVVSPEGESRTLGWTWVREADGAEPVSAIALRGEPVESGCRLTSDRPTSLGWARAALVLAGGAAVAAVLADSGGGETVYTLDVPHDLPPGEDLSFEYVDTWGDSWVDVPSAEGIEVTEERPPSEGEPETIEGGSAYASAGGMACVCGDLPFTTAFVARKSLGTTVGGVVKGVGKPATVASSGGVTWIRIPADSPPGPSRLAIEGVSGEVVIDVVRVDATLDQSRLQRGQSTPMRLTVVGTERSLPLRIVNRSPQVISIEGGDEQRTESSGGPSNTVERQVRALAQGGFDLSYELETAPCPCTGSPGETAPEGSR